MSLEFNHTQTQHSAMRLMMSVLLAFTCLLVFVKAAEHVDEMEMIPVKTKKVKVETPEDVLDKELALYNWDKQKYFATTKVKSEGKILRSPFKLDQEEPEICNYMRLNKENTDYSLQGGFHLNWAGERLGGSAAVFEIKGFKKLRSTKFLFGKVYRVDENDKKETEELGFVFKDILANNPNTPHLGERAVNVLQMVHEKMKQYGITEFPATCLSGSLRRIVRVDEETLELYV